MYIVYIMMCVDLIFMKKEASALWPLHKPVDVFSSIKAIACSSAEWIQLHCLHQCVKKGLYMYGRKKIIF